MLASAKGEGNARAKEELVTLCADFEAKNEKLLGRLLPELWQKIVDEYLDQNDLIAFSLTCRFFRDTTKDLGKKLVTSLNHLRELRKSGNKLSNTLDWFRWVCDTFEILPGFKRPYERVKGAVYEGDLVNCAAFQGSVEILRWLMEEKGWELNGLTGMWAGTGGSVEVLEYLVGMGYEFTSEACAGAARGGHLNALKFLRGLDPPCPWDWRTSEDAAKGGHLDVLKWARSQDPPCPWSETTCSEAARNVHLEVLKWVRSQDPPCPWDGRTCALAAKGGHLEVLKFLRGQDPPCPWDEKTCFVAAGGGHLDVLKWSRDQDPPCPWYEGTCAAAAGGGHLEVLKWLRSQDPPCPWSRGTCAYAAQGGHLEVLKWAPSQDPPCSWGEWTCAEAAKGGHLEVLKWLRAQEPPCPWNEKTSSEAAWHGYLEVLKWARSQDPPCPWSRSMCRSAGLMKGHQHVIDWVDQQEDESDVSDSDDW